MMKTRIKEFKNYYVPEVCPFPNNKPEQWEPIKFSSVCSTLEEAKQVIDEYLENRKFKIIPYP
jgi:hypothetical protein